MVGINMVPSAKLTRQPLREWAITIRMFWANGPSQAITWTKAIFLFASYNISLKETAAALGKTEGAIKLIQHRAVKELQKILGTKEPLSFETLQT